MIMRLNKVFLAGLILGGSALLAACGGGGDSSSSSTPPPVATTDTAIGINPTTGAATVQAVLDKAFVFDSGVPDFGTTGATTLTLSGSGTTPSFVIGSGTSAAGAMTYGSCIFTMATSTFVAPHPLATGAKVTVSPCTLSVATAGLKGDGSASAANVTLVLGTARSRPVSVTVSISASGVVTVNNIIVGSVVLGATPRPTGATGAGS
jgi:hypothetical protein